MDYIEIYSEDEDEEEVDNGWYFPEGDDNDDLVGWD